MMLQKSTEEGWRMVEYPPILRGNEQQQLELLRDYLVRLARWLEQSEERKERGEEHG